MSRWTSYLRLRERKYLGIEVAPISPNFISSRDAARNERRQYENKLR